MTARRSLLVRLLAGAVLIALCSIAATAWLAARSTTVAIQQQQGQALADDAKIYNTLIGYAATHRTWSGVGKEISKLSHDTGRQISLTTRDREPLAGQPVPANQVQSATVWPLDLSSGLGGTPTDAAGQIDARVLGPFKLADAEKTRLDGVAQRVLSCVQNRTSGLGKITYGPTGRPQIEGAPQFDLDECRTVALDDIDTQQAKAYADLQNRVNTCLAKRGPVTPIKIQADLSWTPFLGVTTSQLQPQASRPREEPAVKSSAAAPLPDSAVVEACLTASRRAQLTPYVAPPALLFVSTHSEASAELDLSPANQKRIAGVAAAILGITVLIAAVGGIRLVQPLRALTKASRQMTSGDENVRVRVRGTDEIGQLSLAFNELADARAKTESLRRAMVSDIAHELRTPLSNIRGWLEAVEDGVAQPDATFIASLSEEAALLQHILDDLRDLATADAGNLRIHPERVYLGLLLDQVAGTFRSQAEHAGITLSSATIGDIELEADPVRLRQAVGNLVANALRFTPAGGSVRIEGRVDGTEVVIDVSDTGAGIAPEDLPKVFDRFWRAEQSRNRHTGGSGLGLPIVRSLIEAHGGTTSATSTLDEGSTFTLRLPLYPLYPPDEVRVTAS
ncbi:ATP-binding protein [Streptomyces sp. SID13031]|uniref:sensor histidine kinase n=1 Tax=Streptomyces sp. SID13031 TaxID=2706046 RepID=UPI0013C975B2|nr:ATP-binding protein [Streptomyces sp. SID13031]NEA30882.1 HAMP domain-containing protein [Streptomyces sp. SID13031]